MDVNPKQRGNQFCQWQLLNKNLAEDLGKMFVVLITENELSPAACSAVSEGYFDLFIYFYY